MNWKDLESTIFIKKKKKKSEECKHVCDHSWPIQLQSWTLPLLLLSI